jgi:hypothetical protein
MKISLSCNFIYLPVTSSSLDPNIFLSTLFYEHSIFVLPLERNPKLQTHNLQGLLFKWQAKKVLNNKQ